MKQTIKIILMMALMAAPSISFAQLGIVPIKQLQKGVKNGQILKMKAGLPAWEDPTDINLVSLGGSGNWNGTTGTDNLSAINTAISTAASGQRIYIPSGNYYFSGTINLPSTKNILLVSEGNLFFPANAGINIENAWNNKVYIDVRGIISGPNTGTSYDSYAPGVGVRISNSYDNEFHFNVIQGFGTAAVQMGGKESVYNGSQYNRVFFNNLYRNTTGILLKCEGSVALWCNDNTFTGGKISGKYGVLSEKITSQTDKFNGNKFYNIGYEQVTGSAVKLDFAKHNYFYSNRASNAENPSSTAVISLSSTTENNEFWGMTLYESALVDSGTQNDVHGAIYTPSGVKFYSDLYGKTSTSVKSVGVGNKMSASGAAETVNNVISLVNSRYPKMYGATAWVDGIEKQIPYEGAYQNISTTTATLTENIGWIRCNATANATLTYNVTELPNSSFKKLIHVQNIATYSITIVSSADASTLATIPGDGLYLVVYAQGNWTTYKIGSSGTAVPITNGGNAVGSNLNIGTTDAFNVNIVTGGATRATFYSGGNMSLPVGAVFRNPTATNNAYIDLSNNGTQIWRNVSDNNPLLVGDQNGTGSNGDLFRLRKSGVNKFVVDVNGNVTATQYRLWTLNTAPASATATGLLGEIRIDASYIYVCIATNTWVRSALATW